MDNSQKNNSQKNNSKWSAGYIVIYIIFVLIIIVIVQIMTIRSSYAPLYDWWDGNGGKQYDKFFNLSLITTANESKIFFWGADLLFGTAENSISIPEINFFLNRIFPYTKSADPNNTNPLRFVMPRHVAENIEFSLADDDKWFTNFINKGYSFNQETYPYDETIPLTYDSSTGGRKVVNGKVGVYPSPNSPNEWITLFKEWGSPDWSIPLGKNFNLPNGSDPKNTPLTPAEVQNHLTSWNDIATHPDNFLARYGIMYDAPLVVAFANGQYNDPSNTSAKIDANALKNLTNGHVPGAPGGWMGYLLGMKSGDTSADQYVNYLYTSYTSTLPKPDAKAKDCNNASNIVSASTTGIGIASTAAFAPEFAPLFIILGLAAGIGAGLTNGC